MHWYDIIFELIDLRSFSNLWYWLALSVTWSSASHWVLGVPYDMVRRARLQGGEGPAQRDLEDMLRINVARILYIVRGSGIMIVLMASFLVTSLAVLAVGYSVEFAQAVLCILLPMLLVSALGLRTALRIEATDPRGLDLDRLLTRHRTAIQVIGMFSIFFTAMFGMYQNIRIGVLG